MNKTLYDDYNSCNACGAVDNDVFVVSNEPYYGVVECKTTCNKCKHEDYWCAGYYEKKGNCDKYYFENGKKIYEKS